VVLGFALDRPTREVQDLAGRYFSAVERKDLEAALETLAPAERARWAGWVDDQTGNHYQVEGLAVRTPPLLARLAGASGDPIEATITARITLENGEQWPRPGVTVVRLRREGGRLYFLEPPYRPAEGPGQ